MNQIEKMLLDAVETRMTSLVVRLKLKKLKGKELKRMQLLETALQHVESARLV